MQYGWRTFAFDLPGGLEDASTLAFLALDGDNVSFNITLSRDDLDAAFDLYLADSVEEMKRSLSAYKLIEQKPRKIAGRDARVLEHRSTSPEGESLCLLQAYVPNGKEVVIVTATGRDNARAPLEQAFEHVVGSLRDLK